MLVLLLLLLPFLTLLPLLLLALLLPSRSQQRERSWLCGARPWLAAQTLPWPRNWVLLRGSAFIRVESALQLLLALSVVLVVGVHGGLCSCSARAAAWVRRLLPPQRKPTQRTLKPSCRQRRRHRAAAWAANCGLQHAA